MIHCAPLNDLSLWFLGNPTKPQLVGQLQLLSTGKVSKGVSLTYAQSWLKTGFALSEDLPLIGIEHLPAKKAVAAGAVDDARPDRWGERVIQFIDKPARLSLMEYLYLAGDDRFGALGVSLSAEQYQPRLNGPLPRLGDAQTLSVVVNKINNKEEVTALEQKMIAAGGSLGGAKPKALIQINGEQWVVKFFNGEPVDVPLIEHASMTLAKQAGINSATTQVISLLGENAIAIKRFDRTNATRLHCISAGTALQAACAQGQEPDMSYPNLAQLLRRIGVSKDGVNLADMQELFRRMVFNILIDNTDDHEKNHALIVQNPERFAGLRLSPAYDILPTNSGQGRQEFGVGSDGTESTLSNALSQCTLFGFTQAQAAEQIVRVVKVVNSWRVHFKTCGVSDADIESVSQRIDGAFLLGQRKGF
jgi:serine/threonine-protein kinase HipA